MPSPNALILSPFLWLMIAIAASSQVPSNDVLSQAPSPRPQPRHSGSVCPTGLPVPFPCSQHVGYQQSYYDPQNPDQTFLIHSLESLHNFSLTLENKTGSEIELEHLQLCLNKILVDGCSTFFPHCNLSHQICMHKPIIQQCFHKFPKLYALSKINVEKLSSLIEQIPNCKIEPGNEEAEVDHPDLDMVPDIELWEMLDRKPEYFPERDVPSGWRRGKVRSCAQSDYFVYLNKTNSCAPRCDKAVYFTQSDKSLAFTWLCVWTSVCIVACGFTVLTYFLKCERFSYPERPVIYMSCSCLLYAFGHLLRQFTGVAGVGCLEYYNPDAAQYQTYYLRDSLDGQVWCSFTFMMIYYSQMAIHVWWVVLSFSWFLSAVLHWSPEALEDNSLYFHAVAWLAPACKTLLVLATRRFEGDPLTGLCLVGAQNPSNLAIFIIMPISIYLSVGVFLSLSGFCSLMRIRSALKSDPNLRKMDFLIIRIALFAVCYVVPCLMYLIACAIEYHLMPVWMQKVLELPPGQKISHSIASVHLMLFKHSLTFFIGIATSIWMFNWKTLETWRECFCHSYSPANYSPYNAVKPICPFIADKQLHQKGDKLDLVSSSKPNLTPGSIVKSEKESSLSPDRSRPSTLLLLPTVPENAKEKQTCNSITTSAHNSKPISQTNPNLNTRSKLGGEKATRQTNVKNFGSPHKRPSILNPYTPIAVYV